MRKFNFAFLAILLAVAAVLGGGIYVVHEAQVRRNASSLLDRARRAETGKELQKAEQSLSQFLSINRDDGPAWAWYARLVDQQNPAGDRLERVFLVHEQALRYNAADLKLERKCADLAMQLKRFKDADRHLSALFNQLPVASQDKSVQRALSELAELLGQCKRGLSRFEDAEKLFLDSIRHDPARLSSYDRLARLERTDLRRPKAGDSTINEMVAKNASSGRAYAYRWRYSQEFSPPADANDIERARRSWPATIRRCSSARRLPASKSRT